MSYKATEHSKPKRREANRQQVRSAKQRPGFSAPAYANQPNACKQGQGTTDERPIEDH